MNCPHRPKENVGELCQNQGCWLWHLRAKGNCAAVDTGTTHLTERDIARIYKEPLVKSRERIARGRKKLSAWLALIELAESVDADEPDVGTPLNVNSIAELAETLPLEEIVLMTRARWRVVLEALMRPSIRSVVDVHV